MHIYTWYQFLHGCISHPNLVRLYLFSSVFTYHHVIRQVPTNEQLVIIIFIKSVIPSVSGQEMSLINHFKWQVRTTGQLASYLLTFIMCQVAGPNNQDNWHLPFISQSFQMARPNNQIACVFPFTFIMFQAASPKGPFEFIFYLISSRQS